jgi:regulator of protease activity HflC (stomatin/prohibitin superfamily)
MFDKLYELLTSVWSDIWFFKIINQNEKGLRLRVGVVNKELKPGLVFKAPFIDNIMQQYVGDDTIQFPSQKLTTKDGKVVTITGMMLYNITDVKPFLLNASIPTQTLSDVATGVISDIVLKHTWAELIESLEQLNNKISISVRRECKEWGVHVEYVRLTDITVSRTFNIFKNSEAHL